MAEEVVTFDPAAWAQAFPAFATLPAPTATMYFNMATGYLSNSPCSVVQDLALRSTMLGLVTAHLAQLFSPPGGAPGSGMVGRINSATQGSVSVGAEFPMPDSAAWFNQTPYGAAYWQMTLPFRLARYVPAIPYSFGPIPWSRAGFRGRGW